MDPRSEDSLMPEDPAHRWTGMKSTDRSQRQLISIDILPNDVLLAIFDFYAHQGHNFKNEIEAWQSLVHVCRRWRGVVFGSPRRLNLRLVCTSKTPARDTLDVWPALPLLVQDRSFRTEGVDSIVAVLERSDRVDNIELYANPSSPVEKVLAAMQGPFPELTELQLRMQPLQGKTGTVRALPDTFLGGSVPRLRLLRLENTPFPGLPKLLLSATHLVHIFLWGVPHSGYFSPEAMVTALSTLTSLQLLWLDFQSPLSCPDRESRRPSPPTRTVLPSLATFQFKGVPEYVEDLMTRIDCPRLEVLNITFFNQVVFDTPQFAQFIHRTSTLKPLEKARIIFLGQGASVNISPQASEHGKLNLQILCREFDWQVSSVEQVCTSCLPPIFMLEELYIYESRHSQPEWKDNIENQLWLELLRPFTSVKNTYISEKIAQRIVPALQELVESRAVVLPTLQNIFLEEPQEPQPSGSLGPVQKGIQEFVATRQTTSHPIAVSRWDRGRF